MKLPSISIDQIIALARWIWKYRLFAAMLCISAFLIALARWIWKHRFFAAMLCISAFLNVNYAILRSVRNALAVTDLGGGAQVIPWFELLGTMPGAVLMTLGLTWLLHRYSIQRVFLIALLSFVLFFVLFIFWIYPALPLFKTGAFSFVPKLAAMLFFVMAELWKIALFTILFWGMMNQFVPVGLAKRYYAPLMLAASIGTISAGPLVSFCTSDKISHGSWNDSLVWMVGVISVVSVITWGLFLFLSRSFGERQEIQEEKKEPLSTFEGLKICLRSPYLLLLAWVTIADYIAYALGEIVFLDVLKHKFPDPRNYCDFMGKLSSYNGILTAASALFITPILLRKCRWVVVSLIAPVCLLLTEGAFFFAFWHPTLSHNIELLVLLGSLFFCLVRAAKYTLFDTSKEISFLLLPPLEKMQGKLVVDGMCARLGRGSGSFLTLILIQGFGGVVGAAPLAGGLALLIAMSCVFATSKLGGLVQKRADLQESQDAS